MATVLPGASASFAAGPELVLQIPEGSTSPGGGAGLLSNPRGTVADPATGHLYVSNLGNSRIDEFTAWGIFVRAWGWDVAPEGASGDTPADQFEVCTTACKQGLSGQGAGQLQNNLGIALDPAGGLYAFESKSGVGGSVRVQKFDTASGPAGVEFALMFGGEVNKTTGADVCTKADLEGGDECGAGIQGTADGRFSPVGGPDNQIAHNPVTNTVFVGDKDRIQEFNLDGTFKGKIDFEGELAKLDGRSVTALAVDPTSGNLYIAARAGSGVEPYVYRQRPEAPYELEEFAEVKGHLNAGPRALAVDSLGNLYAAWDPPSLNDAGGVLGFDPAGSPIEGTGEGDLFAAPEPEQGVSFMSLATNICSSSEEPGNLYVDYAGSVSYLNAFGTAPIGCEDPPLHPPVVEVQYAVAVDIDSASLRGEVNPHFWPDTTYSVEYGTAPCFEGGCATKPAPPGVSLTAKSVRKAIATAGIFLADLEPATTYRFRFVAQSSGGGPVFGMDPDGLGPEEASFEKGLEGTFKTFPLPAVPDPCPANRQFRSGPSERLPDCRAYEMVSPLEKNNGDIVTAPTVPGYPTSLHQSAGTGDRFTYSSSRSFGDSEAAPFASQYLAARDSANSWSNEAISPPATRPIPPITRTIDNEFKAFSADLCHAWLQSAYDPPLASGAIPGYANFYRRDNCDGGTLEALTTAKPGSAANKYVLLEFQGASADGEHALFVAPDDLPGTGAPTNTTQRLQLYLHSAGEGLRFVCYLPNGKQTTRPCNVGTADSKGGSSRVGSYHNAISVDGGRVIWTEPTEELGPGKIYLRLDPEREQSVVSGGKCSEAEKACTYEVSELVSTSPARFYGADAETEVVIFSIGERLFRYEFDPETPQVTEITKGFRGVLGISEDASRIYFVSSLVLGAGKNSEGDEAQAGEQNLYLWEEGAVSEFVATLADDETANTGDVQSPIHQSPFLRTGRVSPDGAHAAFMSTAQLTDYDNTDVVSKEADTEVFLYDAEENELGCASCNPSGARPTGREVIGVSGNGTGLWVAARIPTWENPLYAPRALSDDGRRLFFESHEALVARDTNGVQDVYQWEEAGTGGCDAGDAGFNQESGGCVELISAGESPRESFFLDADPSGDNVFFTTLSSLVAPDYGLVDVYDARVGGGFAVPEEEGECEGETCQSPPAPPEDPTPASSSFEGPGNPISGAKPKPCPKGKRRVVRGGKPRCVKKQGKARRRAQRRPGGSGR